MTDTTMNIRLDNSGTSRMIRASVDVPLDFVNRRITAHRNPTPSEIRFGYGATHYRDFDVSDWIKPNGTLKAWIKADDGLRYYRG